MLTWMLFSTALGAVLATAATLAEPMARRARVRTRFLWLSVVVVTIGWSAVVAVSDSATASRDADVYSGTAAGNIATSAGVGGVEFIAHDAATLWDRIAVALLPRPSVHVDIALLALWLFGSLGCLATLGFSAWRIARMRRDWTPRVVAGIPVLVSHDVGPAVIGLVHHGIVVPAWIEALDDASQRLVMQHEREHVRAGDPMMLWGATLLVSLMPWNAALWFALRRTSHAIEIDCDARVLRHESNPHPYCSLLIDVGGRTLTGVAPIAALAEPTTLLERRVTAMLASRTLGYREVTGGLLAIGLIAVACRAPHPSGIPSIGAPRREVSTVTRPLPDSVVRLAVAEHFPRALTGELGHNPYLWFAGDRDDRVLRTASGRDGLRTERGEANLVTWDGAASMLAGVPASAHPGDVLYLKALPVGLDTISVVWVRLSAGLPAR